jgi:hypothetical protein
VRSGRGAHLQTSWPHGGDVVEGIQVSPWGLSTVTLMLSLNSEIFVSLQIFLSSLCWLSTGAEQVGAFRKIHKK